MDKIDEDDSKSTISKPVVVRNITDLQRLKLEKLMKNPEKPIIIPERPKGRSMPAVPDFVRNVMGSSAGAGSGEFHVYRHLRRKEYARQKFIQEKSEKERLNDEYHNKIEENKRIFEEKTAKKRAKRQKKKMKAKERAKKPKVERVSDKSESESESENEEYNEVEKESTKTNDVHVSDAKKDEAENEDGKEIDSHTEKDNETKNTVGMNESKTQSEEVSYVTEMKDENEKPVSECTENNNKEE